MNLFISKIISISQNICFEAIQNGNKSNQIFGGWKIQTLWNSQNDVWCVRRSMFLSKKLFTDEIDLGLPLQACAEKTVYGVGKHCLSGKGKVLCTAVSKEGHADYVLGHEMTHHYWFLWKRCNRKHFFQLPNP